MSTTPTILPKRFNLNSPRARRTRIEKNRSAYRLVRGRQADFQDSTPTRYTRLSDHNITSICDEKHEFIAIKITEMTQTSTLVIDV